jgi:hypothetical protein
VIAALIVWFVSREAPPHPVEQAGAPERTSATTSSPTTAAESLLTGYADPETPPIEDLKKIHRVVTGYFSVVKDSARYPIGGNADLAAALRGENPNREVYVRADHPLFSAEGLVIDRWGSPLVVHPEAWKQLELRSAGPDKAPFTEDDLVLTPAGIQPRPEK